MGEIQKNNMARFAIIALLLLMSYGHASEEAMAAFSLLDPSGAVGLAPRLGRASKHPANPLFGQSELWENRIDNGYVDVVYNESDPRGAWRSWYTAFVTCEDNSRDAQGRYSKCGGGRRQVAMMTASSKDGISWTKPQLDMQCYKVGVGLVNCSEPGAVKTNIVMPGVIGTSVFVDPNEPNASRKYKVVGAGVLHPTPAGSFGTPGGVCSGSDGLNFKECIAFSIQGVHWDTWDNVFWDKRSGNYISTMRANNLNSSNPCKDFYPGCITKKRLGCTLAKCYDTRRVISRVQTLGADLSTMGANGGNVPVEFPSSPDAQNYVQATFPYLNVYMGVLMVYNAASMRQDVHCRLAWSRDTIKWHPIEAGLDLIPLGKPGSFESHICYGSIPVMKPDGSLRVYYFGGDGPHYGPRNSSLAVAEFRPFGLAAIGAAAGWVMPVAGRTVPVLVTGNRLVLSADSAIPLYEATSSYTDAGYNVPVGRVTMTTVSNPAVICSVSSRNVTQETIGDCDLSALVGRSVVFEIEITGGALLYTVGFSNTTGTPYA